MLEESLPAIWASLYSWCTPTVLFVLVNLVIGTIVFSSSLGHRKGGERSPTLARTGSVLERFRSLTLYRQRTEDIHAFAAVFHPESETPGAIKPLEAETHEVNEAKGGEEEDKPAESDFHAAEEHHFGRSLSDTAPTAGEMPAKLPEKIKKSASSKSAFAHFKEEEITGVRRPATARAKASVREDEEVDAKADDFINRFKNQLKLQRLDSIMRYKEMLTRGK